MGGTNSSSGKSHGGSIGDSGDSSLRSAISFQAGSELTQTRVAILKPLPTTAPPPDSPLQPLHSLRMPSLEATMLPEFQTHLRRAAPIAISSMLETYRKRLLNVRLWST